MFDSVDNLKMQKIRDFITKAKSYGASDADVVFSESSSLSINRRLGKEESVTRSEEEVLGLRVFVGKKSAIVSSSDVSAEMMDKMAERAVAMAKNVPEDIFSGIAEFDELTKEIPDLDLFDPTELSVEQMNDCADKAEQAALEYKGITNSEGADFDTSVSRYYYAASNGFSGSYVSTDFGISVAVIAGEDVDMQVDYDFDSTAFFSDLKDFSTIGKNAAKRAVMAMNPRKISTGKMPVVFDNRISSGMITSLASAISGAVVARGTTLLKDKMGQQIFPTHINIVDDPFVKRGARSCPFDAEGVASRKRNIIENGVLTGWFLDLRSARQLGLKTTGNATRGAGSHPTPRATNFYMQPGNVSLEELLSDIKDGFYITELMGNGINIINGDYSRGAKGFRIENGKVTTPVAEVTVAGNLFDMWMGCIPADDLEIRHGFDAPTIKINEMTVAGE